MTSKSYLKPIGLVFGATAREQIAAGTAGALGGFGHIGFLQVEVISRGGASNERRVMSFQQCASSFDIAAISFPRTAFSGLSLDTCRVMGIVNVTPDSFSDGGRFIHKDAALAQGFLLANEGADILDIGGESTRPGSEAVDLDDECQRVVDVVRGLAPYVVSIDTRKADVMRVAVAAGARIVNDVSALSYDAESAGVVSATGCHVILMHAQGEPKTMQLAPKYNDVVLDVYDALEERIAFAVNAGISRNRICIDPGIGFGKSLTHNLQILHDLPLFHGLGVPVLVGLSRKNMVGVLTGEKLAKDRVHGSVGGALHAAMNGAHFLRVHDVKATVDSLNVFRSLLNPDSVDI